MPQPEMDSPQKILFAEKTTKQKSKKKQQNKNNKTTNLTAELRLTVASFLVHFRHMVVSDIFPSTLQNLCDWSYELCPSITTLVIEGHSSYAQSHKFCNVLPHSNRPCDMQWEALSIWRTPQLDCKKDFKVFLLKSNCGVSHMQSAFVYGLQISCN